jgi:hypothetical protein
MQQAEIWLQLQEIVWYDGLLMIYKGDFGQGQLENLHFIPSYEVMNCISQRSLSEIQQY